MFTDTRTLRTHTDTHIHIHTNTLTQTNPHTHSYKHSFIMHTKEHLRTIVTYLIINMHNAKSYNKITNTNIKTHTPTHTVWHRHTQFYTHYDTKTTLTHKEYGTHTHWHTHIYYRVGQKKTGPKKTVINPSRCILLAWYFRTVCEHLWLICVHNINVVT